jgi:PAS domain S-box-containing protein
VFDDITSRKVLDAALRDKTELLQLGQTAARMIILDYDIKTDRLSWSDSPEWLRGPRPASGEYPLFKDQVHPEDRERFIAERAASLATLQPGSQEYRIIRTDGEMLWVLARRQVFADESGKAARLLVAMIDVTERKHAEAALRESESRFRSLTQLSSDWYWEQDEEFGLKYMSGRMGERTGLDAAAYIGRKRWDTSALNLTDEDWAKHRVQLERHQPFRNFEMQRPTEDGGASRWISISGEPLFDEAGKFAGYRGVGSDITDRKQAEIALREAHEELKRSNAELEQFAYVASHDLQEPLRMVSSYTQLLLRRFGERFDGDSREFMGYIVDGAARMKQLIEDLLAYSRVGTRGKEFREVELEEALRRAVSNLRTAIEEAGAAVTWDSLPTVMADDMQLTQLFQNLIGNALKFRSASVPRIHVFCSQQSGGGVHIMVRDNGIGIEAQYFERIFMVFQRLHNKAEYPGTGIGLAICKKVVERHGGRIWVESRPGDGSAFHFTLPKSQGERA